MQSSRLLKDASTLFAGKIQFFNRMLYTGLAAYITNLLLD